MKKITIIVMSIILPFIGISQNIKNDTLDIEEIIIEAGKVPDNLQEIPITASLISAKKIEIQNIDNLTNLSAVVPNLFMPNYGSRLSTPIYIRGIGSKSNASSVGLYVDNIPYFDKGSFNFEFFDIAKIEVLRGPQGTLYGRNTMGGLIKVYTPNPEKNTSGYFKADYGNYNQIKSTLHYNQGISDKFAFLIDGAYAHSDGFFTNIYSGNKADEYDTYSGRIKMVYKFSEKLKANLSVNYEKNEQLGWPYAVYDLETQTTTDVNYDSISSYNRDLFSAGLNLEYNANLFDVSFSGSYQNLADIMTIDQDFTTASKYFITQDRDDNSFVQELNIKSKKDSKIKWLAGLFAFEYLTDKKVTVDYIQYHMSLFKTYDQPNFGGALYGQVSYPLKDFVLIAGIRADYEKSDFTYSYDRDVAGNVSEVDDIDDDLTFTEILPKVSLSYIPNKNITTFASFTKGYKTGGFNTTIEEGIVSYKPEESYNYELGLKTSFFNNKLIANFSAFYIDWQNQQLYQTVPSETGRYIDNAGKSKSTGFEFETRISPFKNFSFWAGMGYNEVKFVEYNYKDVDYKDNYLAYIPKYTVSVGTNYKIDLKNKYLENIFLSVNYQHIGKLYWNIANDAYQENYGLLNGKVSFNLKRFSIGAWAKNILDTEYNTYYFSMGNQFAQKGAPAQFGGFIRINF